MRRPSRGWCITSIWTANDGEDGELGGGVLQMAVLPRLRSSINAETCSTGRQTSTTTLLETYALNLFTTRRNL